MSALLASGVWTEQRVGAWHQCTGCSYLMGLAYGGHPFGAAINTEAERNAFQPNQGEDLAVADAQSRSRYGIELEQSQSPLSDLLTVELEQSQSPLSDLLTATGLGLVLQGLNAKLPTELHRWDPAFQGGHAVFAIALGGGKSQWYDPEAPSGYPGEPVANAVILNWAYHGSAYLRVVHAGMFTPAAPHHDFRVKVATALWNDQTHAWVYNKPPIPVGATGVCRGAAYVKGGKACYPLISLAANKTVPAGITGGAYFVPVASTLLTS